MKNGNILVLRDSFSIFDNVYQKFLRPYLDFFGFPYEESSESTESLDAALILGGVSLLSNARVREAVYAGAGLVCFANMEIGTAAEYIDIHKAHYITELHERKQKYSLYAPLTVDTTVSLEHSETLVFAGENALLDVASYGRGKIVLWHSMTWMSYRILGPLHGMDDILWRSIVWAARKPFLMQGMPPMIGMRVDDVWGSWREISPENPLLWVEIAQKYGLKPWLGLFIDNIDEVSTAKVREYTQRGKATAFPHAFCGCDWIDTDLLERWIYFNHNKGPYSDIQICNHANRAKKWFDDSKIPISKYALAHYYEVGRNALPYLKEWGCEFIGIHMNLDTPYLSGADWIQAGPYRYYETGTLSAPRAVYYGDYVFDKQFFNCVTEIRDVCGYEWAPTNQVKLTIQNGVKQLRRALQSMCPAVLFTHESCWIQRMTPKIWEKVLDGIVTELQEYHPQYLTMDEICRYARAKHDIKMKDVKIKNNELHVQLVGENDINTKCYVFYQKTDGNIVTKLVSIPQVCGEKFVTIPY